MTKKKFDYAGGSGGYLDFLGYPFCRGRIFDSIEEDFGQYDDKKEIFWSSGACFMIKSKVFKEVNGFDFDFVIFALWFAGRIYRVGILTSGSKITYKLLWKWFVMKNY